jgi:hypothetical protein
MAEWRERRYSGNNGRIAEWQEWLHTYYLWYTHTHTHTDDNDDDDDTLIFYSIEKIPRLWLDRCSLPGKLSI